MLRLLVVLLVLAGCSRPSAWQRADAMHLGVPEPEREFRAVWVATVANIDWPSRPGLTARQQRDEIERIVDLAAGLGLNAIVLQVRPHADAIYRSRLEPWSAYLTGAQGGDPGYDPLSAWIRAAHGRGLELHAWINPFRAGHPADTSTPAANHVSKTKPGLVRRYGQHLWMDPAEPRAQAHTLAVVEDIARRYPIDGLHIDDYFYPYPIEGRDFPDAPLFEAYQRGGGTLGRSDWRREHIDGLVERLAQIVRRHRPLARVGISPFGIWRPGHPEGVTGFDAYEGLSADARRWMREGWLDYAAPQLYWELASAGQPFEPLLRWWQAQNTRGRGVWPGLYLTRIKAEGGWAPGEIVAQIESQRRAGAGGFVLFSMVGLLENRQGIADALREGPLAEPALPPEPWFGGPRPGPGVPTLRVQERGGVITARWRGASGGAVPRAWAVSVRSGEGWRTLLLPGTARSYPLGAEPDAVAVRGVGPGWVLGPASAWARRWTVKQERADP